jgi:hypothetical protein
MDMYSTPGRQEQNSIANRLGYKAARGVKQQQLHFFIHEGAK